MQLSLKMTTYYPIQHPLSKYQRIKAVPCMLSAHSAMKLEVKDERHHRNYANAQKVNKSLLNNQWVAEESRQLLEFNNIPVQRHIMKFMAHNENTPEREVCSCECLHQKNRTSPDTSRCTSRSKKQEQRESKVSARKKIIKTRAEMNEIETKQPIIEELIL